MGPHVVCFPTCLDGATFPDTKCHLAAEKLAGKTSARQPNSPLRPVSQRPAAPPDLGSAFPLGNNVPEICGPAALRETRRTRRMRAYTSVGVCMSTEPHGLASPLPRILTAHTDFSTWAHLVNSCRVIPCFLEKELVTASLVGTLSHAASCLTQCGDLNGSAHPSQSFTPKIGFPSATAASIACTKAPFAGIVSAMEAVSTMIKCDWTRRSVDSGGW